ncbi:MAG: transcription termination/antitermination protein NusA, partial [Brevibacterium sp.]|nr:transcription termination/antitermination protein NusA [Brevibacterium sp.]
MDIDLSVLRIIEREREIPLDTLIELIEQALFLAYQKTEGAWPDSRAELD